MSKGTCWYLTVWYANIYLLWAPSEFIKPYVTAGINAMELSDEWYERNHVEEAASKFLGARDGGDPVRNNNEMHDVRWYEHANKSHFAYLQKTKNPGKWTFAPLSDTDVEVLKAWIEKEAVANMAGPISFQCYFACGANFWHSLAFANCFWWKVGLVLCSANDPAIHVYLEPEQPRFLKINPPHQAFSNVNNGHLGSRHI